MNGTFEEKINEIVQLMKERDYDPVAQLTGYVKFRNLDYITRHGGAREKIQELDIEDIRKYLDENK